MFEYKSNVFHIESTNVLDIVQEVSTPFYCYSLNTIRKNYKAFADNIPESLICYAVKASSNVAIIKVIAELGGGADVVSEGEMRRAIAAGVPVNKIVFSGVGKTEKEIEFALRQAIFQINVESLEELRLINQIATKLGCVASVAIRINPNIDAKTNVKITTGLKINKFGVTEDNIRELFAERFPNVDLVGISVHIGSQIMKLDIILDVVQRIKKIISKFEDYGCRISRIDVGGGLGIAYSDEDEVSSIEDYAKLVRENVCNLGYKVICEPGRSIVGNSGILVTKVLYTKTNEVVKHIIVDAGMNDFIRPALYGSQHKIIPIIINKSVPKETVDIVGPICESDDVFAHKYIMQQVSSGDLLAVCDTGAYGASMSSNYNSRLIIPEILVNHSRFAVIRRRSDYEDLIKQETIPNNIYI